jgi:cobalt/nickel transport system ATP-binding protein
MTTAISIRGLTHRYPTSSGNVLDGVDLDMAPGERVALLGPNGSGKTTLALHLNGLIPTQAGTITVHDTPVAAPHLGEIRRRVGLVFQDPDDQLFMPTVRDDVAFGPANLGVPTSERDQRVRDALGAVDAVQLADRHPHHLSGGEKRRAAIATILSMRPDVIVLDEPTSGLDPVGRRELAELLVAIASTQLIVTHDLPFALATCPRSLIVDGGRIAADAPTAELLADRELLARHRLELPFGFELRHTGT